MEVTLLIKSVVGLIIILALLIFSLFYPTIRKKSKKKKVIKNVATSEKKPLNIDLNYLRSIVKKKKSTAKELKEALDLVIKYHGTVHKKLGMRVHPDFDIYMDILFTICRHPNTTKDIIINFDRELTRLNPNYKVEINDAITKGLNSRRV